jgi:hypothetical protein
MPLARWIVIAPRCWAVAWASQLYVTYFSQIFRAPPDGHLLSLTVVVNGRRQC